MDACLNACPNQTVSFYDEMTPPSVDLVSGETVKEYGFVVDMCIHSVVCYLGIVGNILTIIVFFKMGFQETINISMLSITLWDFIKCLSSAVIRLSGPMALFMDPIDAQNYAMQSLMILGYFNSFAGYISSYLAAYVSIERCLCVSIPFTVKYLLTRKVVVSINVLIPIVILAAHMIVYAVRGYKFVFMPSLNRSVAIMAPRDLLEKYPAIDSYTTVINTLSPVLAFIIICLCTGLIIKYLVKSSQFRAKSAAIAKEDSASSHLSVRDRQIIKMLLVIIVIYIVCSLPRVLSYCIVLVLPQFKAGGLYHNSFMLTVDTFLLFDTINAAVNPIVYYLMISHFQSTVKELFCVRSSQP